MITFITALYPEAKGIIERLGLKKQAEESLYQLFAKEDIRLILTGTGMISAAVTAARHFANFPVKSGQHLVINLGVAGYIPSDAPKAAIGDLFLVSKITEQTTGRTFYPDLLYRHSFRLMPLHTVPTVCAVSSSCPEETLLDMEASALYQALLPHFSPDRMLFFKVISDLPGQTDRTPSAPEQLIEPHLDTILSFVQSLHTFLCDTAFQEPVLSSEEQRLSDAIRELLPMTEAMSRDYNRLLLYARLANIPLSSPLKQFLESLKGIFLRGKKQAMPYLARLRRLLLSEDNTIAGPSAVLPDSSAPSLYQPFFTTVYAEKTIRMDTWPEKLHTTPILIDHYKDIFNRSHQDFAAQKKAPALILARKTGTLIYKGAPVCQSFGNEHFYYTSCMMNCIYHCDYCYLQGMYPSGHIVVFVNLTDYFSELELLLKKHPVYLCVSYDTDLLALEHLFSFVSRWLGFAAENPALTLEIRTKSGNAAIFEHLAKLYQGKQALQKQIIFAWTVSPDALCQTTEHGAAPLSLRLKALSAAKASGFSVRLCFDPMIYHPNWKSSYSTLVDTIFSTISADDLYDVSIGVFRISTEYLKNMRKKRPDSSIVQYPYITEHGISHYGSLSEEMVHYMQTLLLPYVPAEKIFVWNGGELT